MTKMCVSEYSDEELKDKFNNLAKKGDWIKNVEPVSTLNYCIRLNA